MEKLFESYINKRGVNEGRIVLHSDLNNFFASVECKNNPSLAGFPVAVCGNKEDRHGIVLAKNELAKKCGVKTAEAIWQAKLKCPDLVIVPPNYDEYVRYSGIVKSVYYEYTDKVESFGLDEAWVELTGDMKIKTLMQGKDTADEIRRRIKEKTGLTVSVGVSDNKIFSKLVSDYKKPDAVTVFGPHNYEEIVSRLDIGELIFVGRSTREKLHVYGINTIGDAAKAGSLFLKSILGKNGETLFLNVSGANCSSVSRWGEAEDVKSVGNSITLPHDLENAEDVHGVFAALAEKVAYRLRNAGFVCTTVAIGVRGTNLSTTERQAPVRATSNAVEITEAAMKLYTENYDVNTPVRSVGIKTANLVSTKNGVQINMFDEGKYRHERLAKIDKTVDVIREKYGSGIITHVSAMKNSVPVHNVTGFAHGM